VRALVVEDHHLYRELLQLVLEENGFHVTTAKDGMEAIKYLSGENNSFHLIITDYNMPLVDGKEVVKYVLTHNIQFEKMYILSGGIENQERLDDLIKGHKKIAFISKSIPLLTLQETYFKL
jgi:CheY-like chemotaxis protein